MDPDEAAHRMKMKMSAYKQTVMDQERRDSTGSTGSMRAGLRRTGPHHEDWRHSPAPSAPGAPERHAVGGTGYRSRKEFSPEDDAVQSDVSETSDMSEISKVTIFPPFRIFPLTFSLLSSIP